MSALLDRANHCCELCAATEDLAAWAVPPGDDHPVLACAVCRGHLDGSAPAAPAHWNCLRQSAWSGEPTVQVLSWRLLHAVDEAWATELLDQLWLDEDTLAWAKAGLPDDKPDAIVVTDSNGAALQEGDSVTLIKDLAVKGGGFTAKRGTMVKNIHLTGEPGYIEGRVNKVAIMLKTEFLKKAR